MDRGLNTRCLHLEETEGKTDNYGALSYPIYQTATYAHPGVGKSTGYDYSRLQNPTREHLEKTVASLEGGIDAFALSTGMAAITLLMELFKSGDHIIAEADLYGGSIRLFDNVSKKNQYEFTYLNCSKNDIEGSIAKKHNLLLIVDNTFLSPYFQNPLKLGADIVIHSGTKFLGGHNDTLAGFIVTNSEEIKEKLRFLIKTTGAGLSQFDSWLILRGIKTLGIRMEKSQEILESVRMIKFAESLGGVETLITYPTTQTHADVPDEVRIQNGITPCTLRLSTGIEDIEDLLAELSYVFQLLE